MTAESRLKVRGLNKRFGGVTAASDLSLDVAPRQVHGLVGPNGAGKSTVLNVISGLIVPDSGTVEVNGIDVSRRSPHVIASHGLARTFQNVKLFGRMTVEEHVLVACDRHQRAGLLAQLVRAPRSRQDRRLALDRSRECLEAVGLYARRNEPGSALSYGEQRRLEIARALATDPTIILLDEPTAGMNGAESESLSALVRHLRDGRDIAFLLVEHNMNLVRELCDFVTVMSFGDVVDRGDPHTVLDGERVREIYFGKGLGTAEAKPVTTVTPVPTSAAPAPALGNVRKDILSVSSLTVAYGSIPAIKDVSFRVGEGELVSLIGSNGAGKSTTLNTIFGVLRQRSGEISFAGGRIETWSATKRVREGLNIVPEGRRVLAQLTVDENLQLARQSRRPDADAAIERVYDLFPRLAERRRQAAGSLSGGEQQMLALGRALATSPRLLMLDEPSMGLAPAIVELVVEVIRGLKSGGLSMLLVEQNGSLALDVADRVYVLERGEVVMEGEPEELRSDSRLVEAYLGTPVEPRIAATPGECPSGEYAR